MMIDGSGRCSQKHIVVLFPVLYDDSLLLSRCRGSIQISVTRVYHHTVPLMHGCSSLRTQPPKGFHVRQLCGTIHASAQGSTRPSTESDAAECASGFEDAPLWKSNPICAQKCCAYIRALNTRSSMLIVGLAKGFQKAKLMFVA